MALTGNCTIPEFYDNNTDSLEFTNIYVTVKHVFIESIYYPEEVTPSTAGPQNSQKFINCNFHVTGYTNKETRDANPENYLFFGEMNLGDYNYDNNLFNQCYTGLKNFSGFENLVDA